MKNKMKISYLLFLCMSLCITASEKISISSLTPEQIAHCKAIRTQVLAETGNKVLAHKTYKRAWSKFYQSSPEFKEHKRIYYQLYKENKQFDNNTVIKPAIKQTKKLGKRSKKSNCTKLARNKIFNTSNSIVNSDKIKQELLETLSGLVTTKYVSLPIDAELQTDTDQGNIDLDELLDQFIADDNEDDEIQPIKKSSLDIYDFDMIFHPEIYNEKLSIETQEQENV